MRGILLGAVCAAALATSAQAASLVTNGDFQAGNTGFGSDYAPVNPTLGQGEYFVTNTPSAVHPSFANFFDHTLGTSYGLMMVVNGADNTNDRVWFENNIAVAADTTYYFSTWIHTVYDQSPAELDFSINVNGIGSTFTAGAVSDGWQQFFTTWNSGSATSADIALVNQNTAFSGNDFAIDDIAFDTLQPGGTSVGGVPEPGAWALMILGFGAAGSMLRRRRAVLA